MPIHTQFSNKIIIYNIIHHLIFLFNQLKEFSIPLLFHPSNQTLWGKTKISSIPNFSIPFPILYPPTNHTLTLSLSMPPCNFNHFCFIFIHFLDLINSFLQNPHQLLDPRVRWERKVDLEMVATDYDRDWV